VATLGGEGKNPGKNKFTKSPVEKTQGAGEQLEKGKERPEVNKKRKKISQGKDGK